ncbi:ATP/GTP-binding protein [Kitasatospora sp. NBC_01302]|uniref:ATP/GTP-binding protein n=1 Tax=Kitasatospora sp. NBC_01302 TaxID=2903575 RepID=UPI002E1616EE|nr:ATP/GTP-binding protein [Kitasatospora sp. NBC_01302]
MFGTNDRSLTADEAFTNRQHQWAVLTAALDEHLRRIGESGFDVQDLESGRNNVITYFGVGGVGKTTLSRRLEAALTDGEQRPAQWGEQTWPGTRILPVRIDLARTTGIDFERVVLTIRLALAQRLGKPMPAFDIALTRYWNTVHPGEPLEEYLQRTGLAGRFGKMLPGQVQSAIGEVAQQLALPGWVGSAVGRLTTTLAHELRQRHQKARSLAGCTRLADLLEVDADLDSLSYYPHLLAWELSRLPAKHRTVPVILLDTFEDVGDRTNRDLERLIQRLVWMMPNTMFVITGRNRLQWADPALSGQLDFAGPSAWPGLTGHQVPHARPVPGPAAGHAGRQILIGDFSDQDCDDYLVRRLTQDGRPLIGAEVRGVITARSHGLPLFLDLSVLRFLEIRRSGRQPEPGDFDVDFPVLVARTLQDLSADERHVLRAVTLLDAWDVDLATRAAGLTHEAPALRLVERPMVREDEFALWPFHLHEVVRSTIRGADDRTDDRWSPQDWHRAAQRAHAALGEQWTNNPTAGRQLLVGCLRQGLALARDHRLELGWLTDAAWAYVGDSIWEPLAPPTGEQPVPDSPRTPAEALVETLSTLTRRQHEHRERTVERLGAVLDSRLLPEDLTDLALYYQAKAQRDLGRSADSRQGMAQVAAGTTRLAPAARRGLAHLARLAGDFPTALATAQSLGWEGRHQRVLGDLWWPQAEMDQAAAAYEAARAEAEQHAAAGERATCQAQLALVCAFADPHRAGDEIALAEQFLADLDLRATTLTVRIAALIRDAGTTDTGVEDRAAALHTDIHSAGLRSVKPFLGLAVCFHYAVLGADDELTAAAVRLDQLTQNSDYAYYVDIARFMADLPPEFLSGVRWLDREDSVRARWRTLVTTRQDLLRGAP